MLALAGAATLMTARAAPTPHQTRRRRRRPLQPTSLAAADRLRLLGQAGGAARVQLLIDLGIESTLGTLHLSRPLAGEVRLGAVDDLIRRSLAALAKHLHRL